jgi:hypothetical protein
VPPAAALVPLAAVGVADADAAAAIAAAVDAAAAAAAAALAAAGAAATGTGTLGARRCDSGSGSKSLQQIWRKKRHAEPRPPSSTVSPHARASRHANDACSDAVCSFSVPQQ